MAPTSPTRPNSPKRSTTPPPFKKMKLGGGRNSPTPPKVGARSGKEPTTSTTSSGTGKTAAGAAASSPSPKKKSSKQLALTMTTTNTSGIMEYLQKALSRQELLGLYKDPDRGRFVCRAVLQRLSEPAQQIVIRLSCTGGIFSMAMIASWFKTTITNRLLSKQLKELYQWAIVVEKPDSDNNNNNNNKEEEGDDNIADSNHPDSKRQDTGNVQLTPEFFQGLKDSLHSLDSSPWNALTDDQMRIITDEAIRSTGKASLKFPKMTREDLERYTQTQWDAVLHYLVGTGNHPDPHPAVTHFLLQTNLMQPDPDYKGKKIEESPLVITQRGYDFMLQDSAQQVWHFVVQYMASMEENLAASPEKAQAMKREALLVLLCLSFARFGECYSGAALAKEGRTIIKDLSLFGLLYTKKIGKAFIFYPTRIAMQLVSAEGIGGKGSGSGGGGGGGMWSWSSKALESALAHPRPHGSSHLAIIVQTNFQLCAYTTSELHVSMLGLFCEVQTIRRLPNVIFMTISRDSIKSAFNLGIQAQQILRFLEKHAHPRLRESGTDPLPGNIVDQIYLWDRERHRVRWNEVFIHQPMMPGEFQAVQKYAMDYGAHSWSSEARNQIMIKYSYVERVQHFIQKWRAKKAAGRI